MKSSRHCLAFAKDRSLRGADGRRRARRGQRLASPDYLRRLTTYDLPKQTQDAFTEVEGPRGRFVGVDADSDNYYSWNGHDLLRIAKALSVEADGKTWVAASAATVFAGILETLIADGPQVTLAALAGVCVLILVLFGFRGAGPVLLSLAIGIVWMGAASG